ncbi:TIGR02281 family clan AA aspartic protease [Thalassospiraceae bacterium LMO-JJ14]|nr:TIGR02281 family clan AA aspartic protease [Thalassospiraceae bacterium LMO-JJ14]
MNARVLILIICCIGVAVLIWFLSNAFPGALESDAEQASLVRAFALMVLIGAGLVLSPKLNLRGALKAVFIWGMIGLVLVVGYTLRDDFKIIAQRLGGALVPSIAQQTGAGEITLNRGRDGHFHASAKVNGTTVQFLVDTGASVVTLSRDDAARAGLNPDELTFSQTFRTANGTAFGAPVRIARLSIGDIELADVRAAVMDRGLTGSLLGMSFLERLSSYSVKGDTLSLKR